MCFKKFLKDFEFKELLYSRSLISRQIIFFYSQEKRQHNMLHEISERSAKFTKLNKECCLVTQILLRLGLTICMLLVLDSIRT